MQYFSLSRCNDMRSCLRSWCGEFLNSEALWLEEFEISYSKPNLFLNHVASNSWEETSDCFLLHLKHAQTSRFKFNKKQKKANYSQYDSSSTNLATKGNSYHRVWYDVMWPSREQMIHNASWGRCGSVVEWGRNRISIVRLPVLTIWCHWCADTLVEKTALSSFHSDKLVVFKSCIKTESKQKKYAWLFWCWLSEMIHEVNFYWVQTGQRLLQSNW